MSNLRHRPRNIAYKIMSICGFSALLLLILIYTTKADVNPNPPAIAFQKTVPAKVNAAAVVKKDPNRCYILYYTGFYRWTWQNNHVLTDKYFEPSKERACTITSKHDYLPRLQDYDALIFFHWNVHEDTVFPPQDQRSPDQLYIMHYLESPQRSHNRSKINPNSHLFNLTMSYRLDSDVMWPYGRVYDKETGFQVAPSQQSKYIWRKVDKTVTPDENLRKLVASKKNMVSWVVSNCGDDPSERWKLAESLKKFLQVDIFGKCGKPCKNCKGQLGQDYFFYLAFENSLATDYVSEKPFSMLGSGLIPVVYGGADYAKFLPPKSYINAQDFKTTKELADFLVALSENTEEYLSYFWWRQYYNVKIGQGYADLCNGLKEAKRQLGKKVQYYTDLEAWEHKDTWMNRTIQFS